MKVKILETENMKTLIDTQQKNVPLESVEETIGKYASEKCLRTQRCIETYKESSVSLEKEMGLDLQAPDVDLQSIGYIVNNLIFPVEWRLKVLKSLTNIELRDCLEQWNSYIFEIRNGKHRNYLLEVLVYHNQNELNAVSNRFKEVIQASYDLANAWTKKDRFLNLRKALEEETVPKFEWMPIPEFEGEQHLLIENESQLQAQLEKKERLVSQIREWNRVVSSKFKVQYPSIESRGDFISKRINDNDFSTFLNWCQLAVKEEKGLFLWC